jgi:hypothetical protein
MVIIQNFLYYYFFLQTPMCVGDVLFFLPNSVSVFLSVGVCTLSDFSQTRPHFLISFCRHLEHCQVQIKFAFQRYWTSYIEMQRFLEL